jgi:transposase, IS5 family
VQGFMPLPTKKRSQPPKYSSPNQIIIPGFETPFQQKLDLNNRWIRLSMKIPWDIFASIYNKKMSGSSEGRPPLSARLVLGALFLKYFNNWSDEDTIVQIQENIYMQYFVGFSSFTTSPVFDSSLFVEIRKRLGEEDIAQMNNEIIKLHLSADKAHLLALEKTAKESIKKDKEENSKNKNESNSSDLESKDLNMIVVTHHGTMITDATACPQDIAFPTDINLLSDAREKTEQIIDKLYDVTLHQKKPRTYRKIARKNFLKIAKNKNKSRKAIRQTIGKQLRFVSRNLQSIYKLLDVYEKAGKENPLKIKEKTYLQTIQTLYDQQKKMYDAKNHTVEDRIVSIHQPHVRPIVRGKANNKVEFGAKINVTIANGFSFLDDLSWDAFNEGTRLVKYANRYKETFGYYPKEILADRIYCNKENRKLLKELGIFLVAKPLGRPAKLALKEYVRPGERNPIEGKFGQAKVKYGLGKIKARLKETSQSWIASIILILNLVKLAGLNLLCSISRKIDYWIFDCLYKLETKLFRLILINRIC